MRRVVQDGQRPGPLQESVLTPAAATAIEQQVRRRVLRWFSRRGLLDPDDARDMRAWANSGFSLDAGLYTPGKTGPDWSGCCATAHAPLRP